MSMIHAREVADGRGRFEVFCESCGQEVGVLNVHEITQMTRAGVRVYCFECDNVGIDEPIHYRVTAYDDPAGINPVDVGRILVLAERLKERWGKRWSVEFIGDLLACLVIPYLVLFQ